MKINGADEQDLIIVQIAQEDGFPPLSLFISRRHTPIPMSIFELSQTHSPKGFFADGGGLPPLSLFFLASAGGFVAPGFAAVEVVGVFAAPIGALGLDAADTADFGPVKAFCAPPVAGFAGAFAGAGLKAAGFAGAGADLVDAVFAVV